jgi:hypothetical protein
MSSLFDKLCTACLKVVVATKDKMVAISKDNDSVSSPDLMDSLDQSDEDINWRVAPGKQFPIAFSTIPGLPD